MFNRATTLALLATLGAAAAATSIGIALAATAPAASRDVLVTPALESPLAPRALVNGLVLAGIRVVAVGQRGHVLLSDDEGKTWRQAKVPVSSDLVAVAFPSATQGYAVGHDGVVLRSGDAGATWTKALDGKSAGEAMADFYKREATTLIADPKRADALRQEAERFAAQGAENPFLDVAFEDEKTGYVVGAFGLALRTTDGGASWQPLLHAIDNPKALHLYAVKRIGNEVWIAGEQGLLLKLDRAAPHGGQFRAVELPYKGTLFGITGSERAVLVHGLRGTVLRSTDAGRSWQPVATGLQVGLTASAVDAQGRIVIVSQAGHVLAGTNDGAAFAPARLDKPLPAAAVSLVGPKGLVVGGPRGLAAVQLP
jgi:photosystem II stability/assembly factor-like uncharacterized protein